VEHCVGGFPKKGIMSSSQDDGYRVIVKKVAFSDGTTWEDDGSMKCSLTEDDRRRREVSSASYDVSIVPPRILFTPQ